MDSNSTSAGNASEEKETKSDSSSSTRYNSQPWDDFVKGSENDGNQEEASNTEKDVSSSPGTMEEFDELDLEEGALQERDKNASDEELEELKKEAITFKNEGNAYFKNTEYVMATRTYTIALNVCPLKFESDRSVLYANRAAARINLDDKETAVLDCNKAIELNPNYMKALVRRAQLHRKMEHLERALEDYKKILELDRNNAEAREACATLPSEIQEQNEKMKQEMFGKLKELGNMCLKPFGLSTDNFQVVQDPNSGGYSVNFQQNNST